MKLTKRKLGIGCAISVGVLLMLVLNPIGCVFLGVILGSSQIRKAEAAMSDPKVYEPVGQTLALYCQSDPSLVPKELGYASLPKELNAIKHGWASICTNSAIIEMGGGFHHFGYRLVLDPNAALPGTNAWQLRMYSEGSDDRQLTTIFLGAEERFSPEGLLGKVVSGFDEQLRLKPADERAYQGKIQAFLRFNRVEDARRVCRQMLTAMPDEWWPVLVNALILAEEESVGKAEATMVQWVDQRKNFFRYMDLAYFHQLTGNPGKAIEAMRQSVNYTGNTLMGHGGNAEYRGYTAAMFAFQSGEYDTVIQLCDHLLKVKINESFAKAALKELKSAAVKVRQQRPAEPPTLKWADEVLPFDPFEDVDIERLLGRPVPRMTKTLHRDQRL